MADDGALTLREDISEEVREAVRESGYDSPDKVLREALAMWRAKRREDERKLAELRAMVQVGLDDIAAGRVVDLDIEDIKRRGRERLAALRR